MDVWEQAPIEAGKLAEIEAKFVEAKANGNLTKALRVKLEKARREYRERWRIPAGVQPATVEAAAHPESVGG